MALNMDRLREWVAIDDDKKNAAALEKKAKKKLAEIEPSILEELVQEGAPQIRVELEARDVDLEVRLIAERFDLSDEMKDDFVTALRKANVLVENRPKIAKTLFIGRRVWAKPVATGVDDDGEPKSTDADYERACRALEKAGWGDYVQERFNIISLSSAVKEEVEHGEIVIPEGETETLAFDGTIIVSETPQLNARKVAAK